MGQAWRCIRCVSGSVTGAALWLGECYWVVDWCRWIGMRAGPLTVAAACSIICLVLAGLCWQVELGWDGIACCVCSTHIEQR